MVIAYDANPLTACWCKRLVRVDTATLVNLVTGTRAVPEFLFEHCTPEAIAPAVETPARRPRGGRGAARRRRTGRWSCSAAAASRRGSAPPARCWRRSDRA